MVREESGYIVKRSRKRHKGGATPKNLRGEHTVKAIGKLGATTPGSVSIARQQPAGRVIRRMSFPEQSPRANSTESANGAVTISARAFSPRLLLRYQLKPEMVAQFVHSAGAELRSLSTDEAINRGRLGSCLFAVPIVRLAAVDDCLSKLFGNGHRRSFEKILKNRSPVTASDYVPNGILSQTFLVDMYAN